MSTIDEIRAAAEADLPTFIQLVDPARMLGHCHLEVCEWWERENASSHQLLLFPRDHMKSALVAFRVAWWLTKDPTLRVLYISATANLAEKQLGFIKNILTSQIYRRYWPDHVELEESKRTKWTTSEISLDHPKRKKENIRDPSVFTAGLTTGLTGMHCDIAVLDDVVVYENAYTVEGRNRVRSQYSLLSSIEGATAKEWVVGTRYHPKDLYSELMEMTESVYDEDGDIIGEDPIYEIFEQQVEDKGDGTGQFLWPRQRRRDGKWFGFDMKVLAKKRGQYLDRTQFRAQYYNDPTDPDSRPIDYDKFQYYDHKFIKVLDGRVYFKDRRLNVFAAVDFAYTVKKRSDYTAIVVVGVDVDNNVYVLDIDRFKTDKISDYFDHILHLVTKWGFRKLRAECTAAQSVIVKELKNNYVKPYGLALAVEEYHPSRVQGSKEERMAAILEPRYDNMQIYHYRGGNCQLLEEELVTNYPPHDDIKDALASCIEIAVRPQTQQYRKAASDNIVWHPRFGGRAY